MLLLTNKVAGFRTETQASEEGGWDITGPMFLVDLSFEYIERGDVNTEKKFFEDNPKLGIYKEWPLVGTPFPPFIMTEAIKDYLAEGPIWVVGESRRRTSVTFAPSSIFA